MQTERPVGMCVARTAVSLLLTLWPPGPLALMFSMRMLQELMSTAAAAAYRTLMYAQYTLEVQSNKTQN